MTDKVARFPMQPRAVRPAPEPLGLYLRVGRNDHPVVLNLLASGVASCFGVVFDPTQAKRHLELKDQVLAHGLDAILDTKAMQLALPGSHSAALGSLPWGDKDGPHEPSDFSGFAGRRLIAAIGDFAVAQGYTEVLAPTHLIRSLDDPWLTLDVASTRLLREHLDRNGGQRIALIYPLSVSYGILRKPELRSRMIDALAGIPADAIWLRVDGFGSHASATAVRTYITAAADFHRLDRKLVADYAGGTVGLALMAFGAVGGIAHGITLLEAFNSSHLRNPRKGKVFAAKQRVYVPAIDAMLTSKEVETLLGASPQAKAAFGCRDTHCCARGVRDMTEMPGRHFVVQRMKQVGELGQYPESLRPQRYLDQHLRPATDKAVLATNLSLADETFAKKIQAERKRLDSLRVALGDHVRKSPPRSFALAPETRAARERTGRR